MPVIAKSVRNRVVRQQRLAGLTAVARTPARRRISAGLRGAGYHFGVLRAVSQRRTAARIDSVADAYDLARRRVPEGIIQAFEAGTGANATVRNNLSAFDEVQFVPRAAACPPARDLSVTVLGQRLGLPVLTGPVGFLRLGHPDGDCGAARAAAAAGTAHVVSGATMDPIEDVRAMAGGAPVFFQLYYFGTRDSAEPVLERIARVGVDVLMLTVDNAARSARERPLHLRRSLPQSTSVADVVQFLPQVARRPRWLVDALRSGIELNLAMGQLSSGTPLPLHDGLALLPRRSPTWDDLPWIREHWHGRLVLKGIMSAADARRADDEGVDAIVVSNHGGNELDGAVASLRVLPGIAAAVGDRVEILFDGGIRRGGDVVKALMLGAQSVLLGRAYAFALLAAGEPGVLRMLELLREQIDGVLACLGCSDIAALQGSELVVPAGFRADFAAAT
jgi:isopentenyl diphosphate isomerase/L-lactate dehydrogenase-like FMN-dependent dehydrogenase